MTSIVTKENIKGLLVLDPIFKDIDNLYGPPPEWSRPQGFETLSMIILEQQVSLESAKAAFLKLKDFVKVFSPENILAMDGVQMRACYISRQKATYLKALSEAILSGALDLSSLSGKTDKVVREELIKIKGIGNWTIDIYLLFCLKYQDIVPLGDIAVINTIKELKQVSTKEEIVKASDVWSPFKSLATFYLWHYYLKKRGRNPVL